MAMSATGSMALSFGPPCNRLILPVEQYVHKLTVAVLKRTMSTFDIPRGSSGFFLNGTIVWLGSSSSSFISFGIIAATIECGDIIGLQLARFVSDFSLMTKVNKDPPKGEPAGGFITRVRTSAIPPIFYKQVRIFDRENLQPTAPRIKNVLSSL